MTSPAAAGRPLTIITGDCRAALRTLPDQSVHCCVTSPPYWGLRAYLPKGHDDKHREIGSEPTPEAFVETMVDVFREVWRVLHPSGTCWLNLGDSYAGAGYGNHSVNGAEWFEAAGLDRRRNRQQTLKKACLSERIKPKDLCMIPWRVALALQADGWWLRSVICWHKKSCMPESVTDRPTNSWEPIFLLAKSARYFYDSFAVRELDTEAVKSYIGRNENQRGIYAGMASEAGEQAQVSRNGQTLSGEQEGESETQSLFPLGEDDGSKKAMGELAKRDCDAGSMVEEIQGEQQAEGGASSLLRERQGAGCDRPLSENTEGRGIAGSRSPQETGADESDSLRPDGRAMGDNQGTAESPVRDVRTEEAADTRPHSSTQQGRAAHGEQYSGSLPKLQRKEGKPKNIIGNMSERGVTRTTEGLNLKTNAEKCSPDGSRNQRNVWSLGPEPFQGSHFAVFPTEIPRRAILAGTSARGCCPKCLAPWERVVEKDAPQTRKVDMETPPGQRIHGLLGNARVDKYPTTRTVCWQPTCKCEAGEPEPCRVLDPFGGSGTTGQVALELGRRAILCELNPEYVKLINERCTTTLGLAL